MTIIEILNTYKKQKHNTYRECDVIHAMNKYAEYREARSIQLMQTDVNKSVCKHCDNKLCDSQTFNQQCFKCGKKPL